MNGSSMRIVVALSLGITMAATARAQSGKKGTWSGTIAPQPAAPPPPAQGMLGYPLPANVTPPSTAPRRRYEHVPVTVTADGRVFANFGRGWEPIVRSCDVPNDNAGSYNAPSYSPPQQITPAAVGPAPVTGSGASSSSTTAPSSAAPSTNAPAANAPQANQTSKGACWTRDAQGRVVIVRQ